MVTDSLCGSAPITTLFNVLSPLAEDCRSARESARRATLLRAGQAPLEPQLASGARQERMPDESHAQRRAAASERPAEHLHQGPVRP